MREGFPDKFSAQHIGVRYALAVGDLPPREIAAYFRKSPDTAEALLTESYDKRYAPSTFITEENGGYSVGWSSTKLGNQCVRQFSNLADAATDYLLFSLGKGRWNPPEGAIPD
jgi:hypothetical protein